MSKQNESVRIIDLAVDQQRIAKLLTKYAESCTVTGGLMRIRLERRA